MNPQNATPRSEVAANAEMVNRAMTDDEHDEALRMAFGDTEPAGEGEIDPQGNAVVWAAAVIGLLVLAALGAIAVRWSAS